MINKSLNSKILKFLYLFVIAFFLFLIYQYFDIDFISKLLEKNNLTSVSIYSIILIFLLRSVSIIIPILPGTYCSVLAGYLYGVKNGLGIIFIADFLACSLSFFISRNYGRNFVAKILGQMQMKRVETISQKYLENNFFLMTGFLLTSWFDFVCYAVGLTKISWKKFMPALILSIVISDIPFVAAGHALKAFDNVDLKMILRGEVSIISGNYFILLIISASLIFCLALLNIFLNKRIINN